MKMLELFSGTGVMADAFERLGFDTVKVDTNEKFDAIHTDAYEYLENNIDNFDVIWAGPDCRTYSYATHKHRSHDHQPISEYALSCDRNNARMFDLLRKSNRLYYVENPLGHMQFMSWAQPSPVYKTTLCKYGG